MTFDDGIYIRFAFCGRLAGHNGGVCALASTDDTMVTGSRDRLIKVRNSVMFVDKLCYSLCSLSLSSLT